MSIYDTHLRSIYVCTCYAMLSQSYYLWCSCRFVTFDLDMFEERLSDNGLVANGRVPHFLEASCRRHQYSACNCCFRRLSISSGQKLSMGYVLQSCLVSTAITQHQSIHLFFGTRCSFVSLLLNLHFYVDRFAGVQRLRTQLNLCISDLVSVNWLSRKVVLFL